MTPIVRERWELNNDDVILIDKIGNVSIDFDVIFIDSFMIIAFLICVNILYRSTMTLTSRTLKFSA